MAFRHTFGKDKSTSKRCGLNVLSCWRYLKGMLWLIITFLICGETLNSCTRVWVCLKMRYPCCGPKYVYKVKGKTGTSFWNKHTRLSSLPNKEDMKKSWLRSTMKIAEENLKEHPEAWKGFAPTTASMFGAIFPSQLIQLRVRTFFIGGACGPHDQVQHCLWKNTHLVRDPSDLASTPCLEKKAFWSLCLAARLQFGDPEDLHAVIGDMPIYSQ